jgi:hypothetical protein
MLYKGTTVTDLPGLVSAFLRARRLKSSRKYRKMDQGDQVRGHQAAVIGQRAVAD